MGTDICNFLESLLEKGLILQIAVQCSTAKQPSHPAEVAALLQEFHAVFATPVGLPHVRGHEHQINLKEGTQPICQRPYMCPYYQKIEIDKIAKELLEIGSIQNSQCPFASPILLVRKADGLWSMCIDRL